MPRTLISSTPEGEVVNFDGHNDVTIQGSCGANYGQWVCITHQEKFVHNLAKDGHISDGVHALAWNCFTHGLETP